MLATSFEKKLGFDLTGGWQARLLRAVRGPLRPVVMSVLAHTLDEAFFTLCMAIDPNFNGTIRAPHLMTAAKIAKDGRIVADVVEKDGSITKDAEIFESEIEMRDQFRRLADRMKLNDPDRIELFKYAQRWVVADRRLDPNFDRRDPDARRFIVH